MVCSIEERLDLLVRGEGLIRCSFRFDFSVEDCCCKSSMSIKDSTFKLHRWSGSLFPDAFSDSMNLHRENFPGIAF